MADHSIIDPKPKRYGVREDLISRSPVNFRMARDMPGASHNATSDKWPKGISVRRAFLVKLT